MSEPMTSSTIVGVIGAGTMGTGIAHVAAAAGHRVVWADAKEGAVAKGGQSIAKLLERDVEKARRSRADADSVLGRIDSRPNPLGSDMAAFRECGLVIEAVPEDLPLKQSLFRDLERSVAGSCVLATNTSSLSVTSIAAACERPTRVVGAHFFNPATLMQLVEVVPWGRTDPAVVESLRALMTEWGKQPVVASDTPGFIVNRVARPFYGEALRLLEEGVADAVTIDWALRDRGGFRMGPFELMDLIGNDVNLAVTKSVWESFFSEPRYRPSLTQQRLVEAGYLGRKSGRGYYDYAENARKPVPDTDPETALLIMERVLAMLINEAVDAVFLRVASARDVDLAMTKGVNYPRGLIAWGEEIGLAKVLGWLDRLHDEYRDDRYRASALLRRMVRDGRESFS